MIGSIILIALIVSGVATTAYVVETNQESTTVISHAGTANAYLNVSAEEIQRVVRWAELIAEREAAKKGLSDAERDVLREQIIASELANYLKTRGIYNIEPRVLQVYAQNTSEATTHLTGNLQLALTAGRNIVQSRNFSCASLSRKYYCYPNSSNACTYSIASNDCQLRAYRGRGYTCLAQPLPVQKGSWTCLKLNLIQISYGSSYMPGKTYTHPVGKVISQRASNFCQKKELEAQGYSCYTQLTPINADSAECSLTDYRKVGAISVTTPVSYEDEKRLFLSRGGTCWEYKYAICLKPGRAVTARTWKDINRYEKQGFTCYTRENCSKAPWGFGCMKGSFWSGYTYRRARGACAAIYYISQGYSCF